MLVCEDNFIVHLQEISLAIFLDLNKEFALSLILFEKLGSEFSSPRIIGDHDPIINVAVDFLVLRLFLRQYLRPSCLGRWFAYRNLRVVFCWCGSSCGMLDL